jgi:hypothetical protein
MTDTRRLFPNEGHLCGSAMRLLCSVLVIAPPPFDPSLTSSVCSLSLPRAVLLHRASSSRRIPLATTWSAPIRARAIPTTMAGTAVRGGAVGCSAQAPSPSCVRASVAATSAATTREIFRARPLGAAALVGFHIYYADTAGPSDEGTAASLTAIESSDVSSPNGSASPSGGLIAGAVVGLVAVVMAVAAAVTMWRRRKTQNIAGGTLEWDATMQ